MSPGAIAIRRTRHRGCQCGADIEDPCASCPDGRFQAHADCPSAPPLAAPRSEPPLPPLVRRVMNFAPAVARDIAAGRPRRSAEEQARILEICRACPEFRESDQSCARCGCPIARKSPLARERCPLGHW